MTRDQFIEYIDEQIAWNEHLDKSIAGGSPISRQRKAVLEDVKKKFLTLTPPPTTLS